MPRYELKENKSAKFWEIELRGNKVIVRWGRIGANPQEKIKDLGTAEKARGEYEKLIASKVKKGYKPAKGKSPAPVAKKATSKAASQSAPQKNAGARSPAAPSFKGKDKIARDLAISVLKALRPDFNEKEEFAFDGAVKKSYQDGYKKDVENALRGEFEAAFGRPLAPEFQTWLRYPDWPQGQWTQEIAPIYYGYHGLNPKSGYPFLNFFFPALGDPEKMLPLLQKELTTPFLFTGLLYFGSGSGGDGAYLDTSSEALPFAPVFYWDHGYNGIISQKNVREYRKKNAGSEYMIENRCLSLFLLDNHVFQMRENEDLEYEDETDEDRARKKENRKNLEKFLKKESAAVPDIKDARSASLDKAFQESLWLQGLLQGDTCYDFKKILAASPDYKTWEKEKKTLKKDSLRLHYWLFAHYFLGNEEEARFVAQEAESRGARFTSFLGSLALRLLDEPEKTALGKVEPKKLAELKTKTREAAPPGHLNPAARSLKKSGGLQVNIEELEKAVEAGDQKLARRLIEAGQNPNEKYPLESDYYYPLQHAAEKGDVAMASLLLDLGATKHMNDAFKEMEFYESELLEAQTKIVSLLLSRGVPVKGEYGMTALRKAASHDAIPIMRLLLQAGVNPNKTASWVYEPPLLDKIDSLSPAGITLLVKSGANINVKSKSGHKGTTPLMVAARNEKWRNMETLLKLGADLKARDEDGASALHCAAGSLKTDAALFLVKAGLDINDPRKDGKTPLFLAADNDFHPYDKARSIRRLILAGASLECKPEKSKTKRPIIDALREDEEPTPYLIRWLEVDPKKRARILERRHGIWVKKHGTKISPLHLAVELGFEEKVSELLALPQTDVNRGWQEKNGQKAPLYTAALLGYAECARLLLDAGANIEEPYEFQTKKEKRGRTPLMCAVAKGDVAMVKFLLERGANPNACLAPGALSVLQLAADEENMHQAKVVDLLIKAGADVAYKTREGETALSRAKEVRDEFPKVYNLIKCALG